MKQKLLKAVLIAPAFALVITLLAGCIRRDNYYNPGSFFSPLNYYNGRQSVSQNNNYYLGPFVSTVTGVLTTKTVDTTESCNKCLVNIYVLDTAPINVSNVNVLNDCDDITVNNITMFQLAGSDLDLSSYIGRPVRLTGTFFLGCSEYHYTKLLMEVCKVEVLAPYEQTCCLRQNWVKAQCGHLRGYGEYRWSDDKYQTPKGY